MTHYRSVRLLAMTALLIACAGPAAASDAKGSEAIDTKGQKGPAPVEKKQVKNDPANVTAPPAKKAEGAKGSGPWACEVHIDNRTPLIVHRVYIDGSLRGGVAPWGDGYLFVGNGRTTGFAEADFDNGETRSWGPAIFNCPAEGSFHWRLLD